jgi:hypothetical protein
MAPPPGAVAPDPRAFFETNLRPAYDDWQLNRLSESKARAMVGFANDLAEMLFKFWRVRDPTKLHTAKKPREYRDALVANECADFQLVWDAADGTKHFILHRTSHVLPDATKFGQKPLTWATWADKWEDIDNDWEDDSIVFELPDGAKRTLGAVIGNVMPMFEKLLADADRASP